MKSNRAPVITAQDIFRDFPPATGQRTLYRVLRDAVQGRHANHEPIHALRGVTLVAQAGQKIALIGNNGAGKSTFLKVVAGLLRPTSGTVVTRGEKVLLTSLGAGMIDDVSVRDNTLLWGSLYGVEPARMRSLLGDVLEWAELPGYEDARLRTLSSGMRQRLAFSVVRHIRTDIFLIDEALSAGDSRFRAKCRAFFESEANRDRTFVVATHDLDFARTFCTQAMWLNHGEVADWGDSATIVDRYEAFNDEEAAPKVPPPRLPNGNGSKLASDVAAVLLSVGEPYRARARQSVAQQTVAVSEIVEVENVTPFSRALNQGAQRVTAPFFVQVDADMILDPECVGTLRDAVRPDTGIVVGELRDALMGTVVGVKLFRTECVQQTGFQDSLSPDTDFVGAIAGAGWKTVYVGRAGDAAVPVKTLGEHRPDYSPGYTYRKYLLEGRRYWHRAAPGGLRHRFTALESSTHPLSPLAQLALGHGLFLPIYGDALTLPSDEPDALRLQELLESAAQDDLLVKGLFPLDRSARLSSIYRSFYHAGRALAAADAGATVVSTLAAINCTPGNNHALVAKTALGNGVLDGVLGRAAIAADESLLEQLVVLGLGESTGVVRAVRARVRRVMEPILAGSWSTRW